MLAAASMGATAFQKGLGGVHAIAHPVGSVVQTPIMGDQCGHSSLCHDVHRSAIEGKTEVIARVLNLPAPGFDGFFDWVLRIAP